ncbi:UDP-N-acetylmuramoyl-tripeptide--D-alanyl-D-alanine ligase [Pedobacter sp. BS3]|uniref:UDP-N-acetylmuramoyl-tripeptide--D-alanyl-D- alanine ligase n=1 Tax=Pedobacter sp. BS3 TaxID=2567937 RepID=UPI0011EC7E89|nr:UDP-N-acetylmuramoyl-tripeptide--D-alanyl-D-alanine ligase [Pedobacter sp. BS3]TZF82045.1 UDP-N-acetylmuramoyl-tripeptide--D-alanyl-D-alanine ligase [Pedobacter sp. BS3]
MTIEQLYGLYTQYPVICTDTRKITEGCLFFALKGENFDANQFAGQAIALGAAYAIIDRAECQAGERFILADDVLTTLQQLARYHRDRLNIPVIGITGTNGKTTTKELINAVLSQKYTTYATQGNLNNHIGVPLTLLAVGRDIEIAVIEMGANHPGEIEFLCNIARPTHGIITNVGKAHLEGFGGYEGVKRTKGELYRHLAQTRGIAFINHDNTELIAMSNLAALQNRIYYGTGTDNVVSGSFDIIDNFLRVHWKHPDGTLHEAQSNLTGTYNFENVLAAICIGSFFELPPEQVNRGVAAYRPTNNRSQITQTGHNVLVCDYYNANPSSMAVALENLAALKAEHKAVILGDMFELGAEAAQEHQAVVQRAASLDLDKRIFVGKEFYELRHRFAGDFYLTTADAYAALKQHPLENYTILLKGSRSMKLEQLVELL